MHMVSRKDLNKAELETVRMSKNPTTVVTANGEVLTREEATVYVRELDWFVTVMLLEDTLGVLSLGKLCEELGYSYHWTGGQKPHLIKKWQENQLQHSKLCTFVVTGFSTSSSTSSSPTSPTFSSQETGTHTEHPAATRKWEYEWGSTGKLVAWISRNRKKPSKNDDNEEVQKTHGLVDEVSSKHSILLTFRRTEIAISAWELR